MPCLGEVCCTQQHARVCGDVPQQGDRIAMRTIGDKVVKKVLRARFYSGGVETPSTATQYLQLPGGTLAFDDQGGGPLVVCVPAGGALRSEYRFLTPQLLAAGYRVVTMDIRGQGQSSARWPAYTDAALGVDMLALIDHLGVDAPFLIGTSQATGAALHAAVQAPERVRALGPV